MNAPEVSNSGSRIARPEMLQNRLRVLNQKLADEQKKHSAAIREIQESTGALARLFVGYGQSLSEELKRNRKAVAEIQKGIEAVARSLMTGVSSVNSGHMLQNYSVEPQQKAELLQTLKWRMSRRGEFAQHNVLPFVDVQKVTDSLEASPSALWSVARMEMTGGEPDVVAIVDDNFIIVDCSSESPRQRRNCVYDRAAEIFDDPINGNAVSMANEMGVEILSADDYRFMIEFQCFDTYSWNWLKTSDEQRKKGSALYGTRLSPSPGVGRWDPVKHDSDGGWRGKLVVPIV